MENEFKRVQQYKNYLSGNSIENSRYAYNKDNQFNESSTPTRDNTLFKSAQLPQSNNDYGCRMGNYYYTNPHSGLKQTQTLSKSNYSDITNLDYYSRQSDDYINYKRRANEYCLTKIDEEKSKRLKDYFEYKKKDNVFLNVSYLDYIQGKKKIGEINPYNYHSPSLGESTLPHNTILNPIRNYNYNKYISKPFRQAGENIFKYS